MIFKASEMLRVGWIAVLALMFVALGPAVANTQSDFQSDMELLKTNIRAQRVDIVTKSMHFLFLKNRPKSRGFGISIRSRSRQVDGRENRRVQRLL